MGINEEILSKVKVRMRFIKPKGVSSICGEPVQYYDEEGHKLVASEDVDMEQRPYVDIPAHQAEDQLGNGIGVLVKDREVFPAELEVLDKRKKKKVEPVAEPEQPSVKKEKNTK